MIDAGYGNLLQHVNTVHLDLDVRIETHAREINSLAGGGPLVTNGFIDLRVTNLYKWIKFIINKGLPFSVVEDPEYKEVVKMSGISRKTLTKYLHVIVNDIQSQIKDIVSTTKNKKFGLMHDGWDAGNGTMIFFYSRRHKCLTTFFVLVLIN